MIPSHLHLIFTCSWAVVLLLFTLSEALVLFAAYFRLNQMEDHFVTSDLVSINRKKMGNGPLGRMRRVRHIRALTGRFDHFQMLDPQAIIEAETFPERLKKWVNISGCLFRLGVAGAALLVFWLSFEWLCTALSKPASDLKLVFIATLIACLVLAFMAVLAKVYISFVKLAEIESLLRKSYFIARNRRVMGDGAYGRYCRLSHVSTMLLLDDEFLSFTDSQAINEIVRFPSNLRYLVIIPTRILAYSFLGYCSIHIGGNALGVFA
ncbi:hypothetical protein [Pseudomonas sp. TH06]|uniref:hypothetical protein n=1 Tax=Pseudomonas sp. TH06 TaxID=2796372 RepID=UPI003221568C